MSRTFLLRLLAGCVAAGSVASTATAVDERERIRAERRQAQSAYESQVQACHSQFAVTSCVERAQARRRAALKQLSSQEAVLDDAERRQRAAQRMKQIQEKSAQGDAASAASRGGRGKTPSVVVRTPRASRAASAADATASPQVHVPLATGPGAAQQAQNRADYERRQREAAEHRERVQRLEQERLNQGKPAPGLPPRPDIPR